MLAMIRGPEGGWVSPVNTGSAGGGAEEVAFPCVT